MIQLISVVMGVLMGLSLAGWLFYTGARWYMEQRSKIAVEYRRTLDRAIIGGFSGVVLIINMIGAVILALFGKLEWKEHAPVMILVYLILMVWGLLPLWKLRMERKNGRQNHSGQI